MRKPAVHASEPLNSPGQAGRLQVRLEAGGHALPLAVFRFESKPSAGLPARLFGLPLPLLAGAAEERWLLDVPLTDGQADGIRLVRSPELLLCEVTQPVDGDMQQCANQGYQRLLQFLQQQEYPHIVKIWNHIPDINQGEGDAEAYKRFCFGRGLAMDAAYRLEQPPAATGVGIAAGEDLQLLVLAARKPPRMLENPRQVSAFHYPRQYGPRSPSFSRAVILEQGGEELLMVSGTAAIVGHDSRHERDVTAQVQETLNNWRELFDATERLLGRRPDFDQRGVFRAYLRHAEDLPACRAALENAGLPMAQVVFLQADICRRELLFELDGMVRVPAA